jgi:mono/diheme cytochrome c family protein
MRRFITVLALAAISTGCGGGEPAQDQEEGPTQAQRDTMAMAAEAYDPAAYDTITWDSLGAAVERGQVVYQFSCQKCHGADGAGEAGFVRGGDTLRPPSFAAPDWELAGDTAGIREQIFVGTAESMPHWGLAGLKPRDIEAVSIYILETMRPEEEG